MAKNKIITSQGNVQFINSKGKTISMHPMHCYAVYQDDTVSFLFIYMKEYSGQAFFASQYEDLEVDGETYDSIDALKEAIAEAFAKAGAQARTEIVDELPETGYTNTIYLVKKEHGEGYDEYIYNEDEGWQLIGDTDIEFERYLQKVEFNAYSADTKEKIDYISGAVDDNASDIQFISGAVSTEIANREAADTVISGAVDTLSTNLSNEVQRAQNAEQTLQNNINTANARIDAEQIARANADNAISGAVDSVVSDLASEVSRAEGVETALSGAIDTEISAREAADTVISGAVDSLSANLSLEVQRAQNAESALNSKVNAISGEVETMGDEAIVDAAYVSSSTTIDFYNADGAVVAQVDASDFIKDGMIEDVRIENGNLVIDFNTASGKQDISIPLTDIFNPDNYYDKTAVDGLLANKANSADVYIKSETDGFLADKADLSALTEDERVWGESLNDLNSKISTVSGDVASKASQSAVDALNGVVTAHTADTTVHVTSAEKATWNAKSDFSGDYNDLTNKLSAGTNITIVDNVISAEGGGIDSGAVESIVEDYMTDENYLIEYSFKAELSINEQQFYERFSTSPSQNLLTLYGSSKNGNIVPTRRWSTNGLAINNFTNVSNKFKEAMGLPSDAYSNTPGLLLVIKSDFIDTIPEFYKDDTKKIWLNFNQNVDEATLASDLMPTWDEDSNVENRVGWSEVSGNSYFVLDLRTDSYNDDSNYGSEHPFDFSNLDFSNYKNYSLSLNGNPPADTDYMINYGSYLMRVKFSYREDPSTYNYSYKTIITPLSRNKAFTTSGSTLTAVYDHPSVKTFVASDITSIGSIANSGNTTATEALSKANTAYSTATYAGNNASSALTLAQQTATRVEKNEKITAYGLTDLDERFGGIKFVKISSQDYEDLETKDNNTLYIITD